MLIDVRDNRSEVLGWLTDMQHKQLPFATSKALNVLAITVTKVAAAKMKTAFDRPTRTALNSVRVKKWANKSDLTAEVWLKDIPMGGKNPLSMAEMIGQQFGGGTRIHKNYERVLVSKGLMNADEYTVPAAGAKLNSYGNISNGQIVQILSQIGIKRAGFDSTPTGSARSRRNVARAGVMFWSRGPGVRTYKTLQDAIDERGRAQHLPKGVWMRVGRSGLIPVLLVIKVPRYRQRINLDQIGSEVVARDFDNEMTKALDAAMATAR